MVKKPKRKTIQKPTSNLGCDFPIVAIGASAGGLQAVTELLDNLPPDTGISYIYIQHLSPDYKSMLAELLGKRTKMKVQEVQQMVELRPDNFYVVPPNKDMEVVDGHIKLSLRPTKKNLYLPIDNFFLSLAEKHTTHAIGVILSGAASDGARGITAIKQHGGITFAQDKTATVLSMPQAAVAAGGIDFILPPKEIAQEICRIGKQIKTRYNALYRQNEEAVHAKSSELATIFTLLLEASGVDFSQYKISTVKRRIIRRMLLYKLKGLKEYIKLLKEKDSEIEELFRDLLINVTTFFRDTQSFRYLKTTVFPRLLKEKEPNEPIRIWVPACATGEEAYSIAMILLELQEGKKQITPIQIFATDLSLQALEKARQGEYSKEHVAGVSAQRLQKFFSESKGLYRITKALRDVVVFAQHNILQDPPFSRIDFISCCNLLIYFDAPAQRAVLNVFRYALKDGGCLMLGKSESISHGQHLFTAVNKVNKIFVRKKGGARHMPNLPFRQIIAGAASPVIKHKQPKLSATGPQIETAVNDFLLTNYIPPCAVINYDFEIIQFKGATWPFLRHAQGKASLNILKMSRPEISFELRATIQKAIKTRLPIIRPGIETRIDGQMRIVSIEVTPLTINRLQPLLLIVFREIERAESIEQTIGKKERAALKDARVKKLEADLQTTYGDIKKLNEMHEASIEELQGANEEIVSSNEELQSVNEELKTAQEETESANEELITTNQELLTRNQQLMEAYDFSDTVMATMHEPLLVLDNLFSVRFGNAAFYRKFKVTPEETVGRQIFDLGNGQWNVPKLLKMLHEIIPKNSRFQDFEITHTFPKIGTKTMLLNAHRILQKNGKDYQILLAIADTTDPAYSLLKEHNKELESAMKLSTAELVAANKSLEKKNLQLENANKELSSFAYISSHDLQEPLRKIQTISSRLIQKESVQLSDDGKNYLKRVQREANRMQQLIEDLLAYSRTGNGERKLVKRDLNKILAGVTADMKDAIKEKGATIEVRGLQTIPVVEFQIRQLLYNLISNALKFSKPGRKPRIVIKQQLIKSEAKKEAQLTPGMYHLITVSDNGIGFKPEFNERIFEVFQRLHGKDQYPGTGIGLAIVKKIVDNHHGMITAVGVLGKGVTFNIYLPVTSK